MTKKDYILIARALNDAKPFPDKGGAYSAWKMSVTCIREALESENSHFDRSKFLAACGVQQ